MSKKDKTKLNPKQEMFCRLYSGDSIYFGNAVMAYIAAYNPDVLGVEKSSAEYKKAHQSSRASASKLLTNDNILRRCREMLEESFNNQDVDAELAYLIKQRENLPTKVRAIAEYNKLGSRILERSKVDNVYTVTWVDSKEDV